MHRPGLNLHLLQALQNHVRVSVLALTRDAGQVVFGSKGPDEVYFAPGLVVISYSGDCFSDNISRPRSTLLYPAMGSCDTHAEDLPP
jgi:hypothetical protein